jgi:regulator of nucleoside diphosphate kinase
VPSGIDFRSTALPKFNHRPLATPTTPSSRDTLQFFARRPNGVHTTKVSIMHNDLQTRLPPITISARDAEKLRHLADAAAEKYPATAEFLARELDRAKICPADRSMRDIVAMDSEVTFRDDVGGHARTVTLVYPDAADVDANKISVLTPIGSALIGLSAGQTIEFQTPSGGWRSLTVTKVHNHN